MGFFRLSLICLSLFVINQIDAEAQQYPEILKFKPGQENKYSSFGSALAMHGNTVVVGAETEKFDSKEENYLLKAGAVYVFEKDGKGNFIEKQKITPTDRKENDRFGAAIALNEHFLFIGAPKIHYADNMAKGTGNVYVYKRGDDQKFELHQILIGPQENKQELFGRNCILHGNQLMVSAEMEYLNDGIGAVYVFELVQEQWELKQKLVSSSSNIGVYGNALAAEGEFLAIGAHQSDIEEQEKSGCVFLYKQDDTGFWSHQQTLTPSDLKAFSFFGNKVSLKGNDLFVADDKREGAEDLKDNLYLFRLIDGHWVEGQVISAGEFSIHDLKFSQEILFVGAPLHKTDENGVNSFRNAGAVLFFKQDDAEQFFQLKKSVPSQREEGQHYGAALYVYNQYLVVGAFAEQAVYLLGSPNVQTDILSFALEEVETDATIDVNTHTIALSSTEVTSYELSPRIEVSAGASISPESQEVQDFSREITYRVTAEDGESAQDWTVIPSFTITAIADENIPEVKLYPVPTRNVVRIESKALIHFQLYTSNGRLLDEGTEQEVSLLAFPAGIYLLHIHELHSGKKNVYRMVKE